MNKTASIKNYKLYFNISICFFFAMFILTSFVFNRKGLSFIININAIAVFLLTGIRIIVFKENIFDRFFVFYISLFIISLVSNLLKLCFSYNYYIALLMLYSSYSLNKSLNNSKFTFAFIFLAYICYSIGMVFYFIYFFDEIIHSGSITGNFFMNLDALALSASVCCCVSSFFFRKEYMKKNRIFVLILSIIGFIFSLVVLLCTTRIGAIFTVAFYYLLFVSKYIKSKNKKMFYAFISIFLFAVISILIYSIFFTNSPNRIKTIFIQLHDRYVYYEGSTHNRLNMLIRDVQLIFKVPFLGLSYNYSPNSVGHNAFGDIGVPYGLCCFLIYVAFTIKNAQYSKYNRSKFYPFYLFMFAFSLINFFYGMEFSSRIFNIWIGISSYLVFFDSSVSDNIYDFYPLNFRNTTGECEHAKITI